MQTKPIQSIIILGGGTAGWLAANHLAINLKPKEQHGIKITVIESPDTPTIGVGEGTVPLMRNTLKEFGISEKTFIKDPMERRGADQNLWVWETPDYTRDYIVVADVSRGDGKDYSAFHVIDVENNVQVAEYKGQINTKDYDKLNFRENGVEYVKINSKMTNIIKKLSNKITEYALKCIDLIKKQAENVGCNTYNEQITEINLDQYPYTLKNNNTTFRTSRRNYEFFA